MQKSKIIIKLIIVCIFMMLFLSCDLFLPESYAAVSTKILKGTLSGNQTYHVGGTGINYSGTETIYTDLGDKTNTSSTTAEELHISGDITFIVEYNYINIRNKIVIDDGGKLTIRFSDNFAANGGKYGNSSFQRYIKGDYPYNSDLFWVSEGGELDISGNNTSERVIISGGYQFQIIKEDRNGIEDLPATAYDKTNGTSYEPGANYTETNANYAFKAYSGLIRIIGGKATLNNIMLVHNRAESIDTGGAIHIAGKKPELKLENSVITRCYTATAGSAIYLNSTEGGSAIVENCQIYECFSENGNRIHPNSTYTSGGGTVRCIGQNKCKLKIIKCNLYNNYNQACGAITWNAGQIEPLEILGCNVYKNTSDTGAAGVYCASRAIIDGYDDNGSIIKTKIYNNWAKSTGAGLTITTWSSDGNLTNMKLEKGTITLSDKVEITGNYAGTNGGGIYFNVRRISTKDSNRK